MPEHCHQLFIGNAIFRLFFIDSEEINMYYLVVDSILDFLSVILLEMVIGAMNLELNPHVHLSTAHGARGTTII